LFEKLKISQIGGKKIYFASDFHLGAPNPIASKEREQRIVNWLDNIKEDAQAIFLVGDIFDFWFEYKKAIPKGFVRFQAKIAEITDKGIPVYFFIGNHDMWMFDYFEKELGVKIFRKEIEIETEKHQFLVGHGDGLGPKDLVYKFFKLFFRSAVCIKLFGLIHPNYGIGIANFWSGSSRKYGDKHPEKFLGDDEWILEHCKEQNKIKKRDFYIYGHRHLVIDKTFDNEARYINLGHWFEKGQYAAYDGNQLLINKL